MIHQLFIGGELRPVSFANYCFRRLERDAGVTLLQVGESLLSGSVALLPDVLFYGLLAGRVLNNGGPSMQGIDADRVAIWMDETPEAMQAFTPWLQEDIMRIKGVEVETATEEGVVEPKKAQKKATSGRK